MNHYVERAVVYFSDALLQMQCSDSLVAALKDTTSSFLTLSHEYQPAIMAINHNGRAVILQLYGLPAKNVKDNSSPAFWFYPRESKGDESVKSITMLINWNQRDLDLAAAAVVDFFIERISYEALETKYIPFFPTD